MATFQLYDQRSGKVLLETDDWVEAEQCSSPRNWPNSQTPIHVRGTHPTHDWDEQHPRRCRKCDGWDNGSYGSHAPCGYVWDAALVTVLERELAARSHPTEGER